MRFTVLGPITVVHRQSGTTTATGDRTVDIPGALRRALLAYLLLHRDRPVELHRLIDALWGGAAPATAKAQIQAAISALRRALSPYGGGGLIVTETGGYRAVVAAADLDLGRFETLVAEARAAEREGELASAVEGLRMALAQWHGPALLGATAAFVEPTRARLSDQRLGVLEEALELELRLGRQSTVLAELIGLAAEYPLRERLCGQLMLALHRCGRTPEAVAAYRQLRERLVEETGVEPGRQLAELAKAILRGDPALDLPLAGRQQPGGPAASRGTGPSQDTGPAGADESSGPGPAGRQAGARPATDRAPDPRPRPQPSGTQAPEASAGGGPSKNVRPTQLPGDGGHFVGREGELAELDAAVGDRGDGQSGQQSAIVTVTGPGGAGKTALALTWAHRQRPNYPDGQLYLDLGGHSTTSTRSVSDVLAFLLRSVGAGRDGIPADLDERCAAYRSAIADRRMILVLDNAANVAQIEPLLPTTPGCAVVVTSRHRLDALAVRHAVRPVQLDVLPRERSVELLRSIVGRDRLAAEPAAASRLAELCGDLPLALRIVAARLLVRPGLQLTDLAAELADAERRLSALDLGGEVGVRAAFATSYGALSPSAARAFRLISVHPGPDFTAAHLAAVTDEPYVSAVRDLDELAAVHLVGETGTGRFRRHDLIRLYATELTATEETPAARQSAWQRLVTWYLGLMDTANLLVMPHRTLVPPVARYPLPPTPRPTTEQEAFTWFDAERDNIVALVASAREAGADQDVQQLTYFFTGYVERRVTYAHELQTMHAGAVAAARLPDRRAEGVAVSSLAIGYAVLRRYDDALENFERARKLFEQVGDERRMAGMLGNSAIVHRMLGHYDQAVEALTAVLEVDLRVGDRRDAATCLNNIGKLRLEMGEPELAVELFQRAAKTQQEVAYQLGEASALVGLAQAYADLKDPAAEATLRQAELLAHECGDRNSEARALVLGAELTRAQDPAGALARLRRAREIFLEVSDAHEAGVVATTIGMVLTAQGDLPAARESLRESAGARREIPDALEEARLEHAWGNLAAREGDLAAAGQHWSRADARYAASHSARAHALRASLAAALG